jgi:hypothetical protein
LERLSGTPGLNIVIKGSATVNMPVATKNRMIHKTASLD